MRIQHHPKARSAAERALARRPIPFTFQCNGCEAVEHRPRPILPVGWVTVEICGDLRAFCGVCIPGLPCSQEPLQ